jgi:hypothetical protein
MSAEPDPHRARQVLAITCGATFMAFLAPSTCRSGGHKAIGPRGPF